MSDPKGGDVNPNVFPNAHLIWTPAQLKERLGDENLAILDLRPTHEVMGGIIPGATHLDIYGLGLSHTRPGYFEEFANLMRSQLALRGAGAKRTVVVYEETTGVRAARAFWLLDYLGHPDFHLLDGGIKAWRAAGYETTTEMEPPRAKSLRAEPRPQIFIGADDLNARLGQPGLVVLDTRADDEWLGENTRGGPRGGTIPGAIHLEWSKSLDEDGKFKPPDELAALFEGAGVTRDKAIVPF